MGHKNKSLIILTPGFPSSEEDSTCLPLQQYFIRKIQNLYPELKIYVLSFQYPYVQKKYDWYGSSIFSYSGRNKGGISRLLLRRKIYSTLRQIHATTSITGLLSFWLGECALTGKRFAEQNGLQHYCWLFGQDARKENKYAKRVHPAAHDLVALSDFLQQEFEKNHHVKPAHVIPLGLDPNCTDKNLERDIDILGTGSLIPLKQYDIFLHVVANIKQQHPAIRVMLAGDGPEKEKLREMIGKLDLTETVTLTGELPHSEVLKLMQRTKLFLHPSSYEGFSGVCLEALSNGAHVISFCRAMAEEIDQWHIVHFEEEMLQKALKLLEDPMISYKSVTVLTAEESARKMMMLYSR